MYLNWNPIISSKKLLLLTITTAFLFLETKGQLREGYKADIEVQAIGTTNGVVPFWMRSNQFGSIPLSGLSSSAIGRFSKSYSELTPNEEIYGKDQLVDWGFGFEGRANGGKNSNLQLIEAYVKGKISIFQLKLGRSKEVMGLTGDTTLSSGNFAISGNALGIPQIDLSINEYTFIPIFEKLFALKGNFSHGWAGKTRILITKSIDPITGKSYDNYPKTYFHQKSLYVRLGREDWPLKLTGGFSHQVFWGNEQTAYGENFKLSPLKTFFYVITGKAYGSTSIARSKIGNQLGSIDISVDYSFPTFHLTLYRQSFYDVGALSKLANIKDGLNGLTIKNPNFEVSDKFSLKTILLEFFYSKDQAGYPWSTPTKSGDEDYYNNYYYKNGWSYFGEGLGNPLITPAKYARRGQINDPFDYFINNRVIGLHAGIEGAIQNMLFKTKLSYSRNYGTFSTSEFGKSTGGRFDDSYGLFKAVNQWSFFLEAEKQINNDTRIGFSAATDQGKLLDSSVGLLFKIKRTFN